MAADTVYCYVLDGNVTVVTDMKGNVNHVVCPKFNRITNHCDAKVRKNGLLRSLFLAEFDKDLDTRVVYCEFGDPKALDKKSGQ